MAAKGNQARTRTAPAVAPTGAVTIQNAAFTVAAMTGVIASEQRGHGARVGGEAALEHHGRLGALERGEPPLELHVQRHRAGDRPHRAGADAQRADGLERPLPQRRVGGQTEIVVRREVDDRTSVHRRPRGLLAVEHAQRTKETLLAKLVQRGIDERQRPGGHGKRVSIRAV